MSTVEEILKYNISSSYHDEAEAAIKLSEKTKAISFAKWLSSNGYMQYDEPNRWISQTVSGNRVFSTEE